MIVIKTTLSLCAGPAAHAEQLRQRAFFGYFFGNQKVTIKKTYQTLNETTAP